MLKTIETKTSDFTHDEVIKIVRELMETFGVSCAAIAGTAMVVSGIRPETCKDIDLIVPERDFERLLETGQFTVSTRSYLKPDAIQLKYGNKVLQLGPIEIFQTDPRIYGDISLIMSFEQEVQEFGMKAKRKLTFSVQKPEDQLKFKMFLNRDKDQKDIELLKFYLNLK